MTGYQDDSYYNISRKAPLVIMICGKKCTGKSTAAAAIADACKDHGLEPFIVSLGAAVKDVFLEMGKLFDLKVKDGGEEVPVQMRHLEDRDMKERLRPYLQTIGSDVMRNRIHKDIWSLCLYERIRSRCDALDGNVKPVFIIDDIRYQNELRYFEQKFCYTITLLLRKEVETVADQHESECQDIVADFVYTVDRPIDVFRKDLHEFVDRYAPNMRYQKYYWCSMVDWKDVDPGDDWKLSEQPEVWVVRR